MPLTLTIDVPLRPWSLNAERSEHRMKRAKITKAARNLVVDTIEPVLGARGIARRPVMKRATIDAYPHALDRRYRQDPGNCYPSVKACVDGCVDAGLLADDSQGNVEWIRIHPHQFGRDAIVLVLTESEAE